MFVSALLVRVRTTAITLAFPCLLHNTHEEAGVSDIVITLTKSALLKRVRTTAITLSFSCLLHNTHEEAGVSDIVITLTKS